MTDKSIDPFARRHLLVATNLPKSLKAVLLVPLMIIAVAPAGWPVLLYDNGGPIGAATGPPSDFSASGQAGDDFSLSMAATAQQIEWWGFYPGNAALTDDFTIRFFGFTGGSPDAIPLFSYGIGSNLTRINIGPGANPSGTDIYRYSAIIPDTLLAGTTPYLLSIVNNTDSTSDWFWQFTGSGPTYYSRQADGQSWSTAATASLAFNISGTFATPGVPESGASMLLLGVAFVVIFVFRSRLGWSS